MTQFRVEARLAEDITMGGRSSLYRQIEQLKKAGQIEEALAIVPLYGEVLETGAVNRILVKTADREHNEAWGIAQAIGSLAGISKVLRIDDVTDRSWRPRVRV